MKHLFVSKLPKSNFRQFIFSIIICLLALQIIQSQALYVKKEIPEFQEIPAYLRKNPAALRNYLQKQELSPNANLLPTGNLQSQPNVPGIGNIDQSFSGSLTEGTATVNSTAVQTDGKILIGGFYSTVNGVTRRCLERLNADGSRDTTFNPGGAGANGTVYVIIPLPDGKILISGNFTTYNGTLRGRIARLNADGTLDTTFTVTVGTNNSVQDTIIQPDGKILISGNFTTYDGTIRNRAARLNADGTLDTAFNPNINGFTEEMILQPDGKILIGGIFSTVGGVGRNCVARLNADGTLDTSFNPGNGVMFFNGDLGSIYGMERQADGKILIGGDFDTFNNIQRTDLARLNTDGSLDTTFTPSTNPVSVEFFTIQADGKILVAGNFSFGSIRYGLVRLNADGTNDAGFTLTPLDDLGYTITLQADGKIVLGGYFTGGAKRFNVNGSLDSGFNVSVKIEATVRAIKTQPDGKVLVGGDFRLANGTPRRNIARFNADGSLDTSFDPGTGADNIVYSLAVQSDGKILVGGFFLSFNGTPRNLIARLNPNGSLDSSFIFSDGQAVIYDIEVQVDGKIVLGGFFDNISLQLTSGIVRLQSNGSYDAPAAGFFGTNGFVTDVEILPNGKYLISGSFTTYNNISRSRIARLNADLSLDTTFNPGTGANAGTIWDVAPLANGQMYLAGSFTAFNGNTNFQDVIKLNADGSIDTTFASGVGFNGTAFSILPLADGKVLVGGQFFNYQTIPVTHLAQLNVNGSLDTSFNANIPPDVFFFVWKIITQTDGRLLLGGRFNSFGGQTRNSIVRLFPVVRAARFDYDGDGKADISVFRPSNQVWYLNRSTAGFGAVQFGFSTDKLTPADYDGDGKTDVAVFRDGVWYWLRSSDLGFSTVQFGSAGDIPQPADFDGDGKTDLAVFRQGVWYVLRSSDLQVSIFQFGIASDKAVAADYDGDGKTDAAVYRNGTWWILRSTDGGASSAQFGNSTDKPVPADFDGDGKTDLAIYRDGVWYWLRSSDGNVVIIQFGIATDQPAPADFDGDGKADVAVFRNGVWYIQKTSDSQYIITQFGVIGDKPTPAAFVP